MIELKVTGMSCGGCVNSVRRAVERVVPGSNPDVELASGLLRVHLTGDDSERIRGDLIAAIEAAGFGAEVLGSQVLGA